MASNTDDLLIFNGVNGSNGFYGLNPMRIETLKSLILKEEVEPDDLDILKWRNRLNDDTEETFAVAEGHDPNSLAESGWGVVFPAKDFDPAIKEALEPLLALRRQQAGDRYYEFEGPDGYRTGKENAKKFLSRHGQTPGRPIEPTVFPYYLLVVGSPEQIDFRFQYQLSVQGNIGRIYFDTVQEYANYAASVVAADKGDVKRSRSLGFFGVSNRDDRATQLSSRELIDPLHEDFLQLGEGWDVRSVSGEQATKAQLTNMMGGSAKETPSVLFTASHGMEFDRGDPRQLPHQGALLCQDWPGPRIWKKQNNGQPIPERMFMSGDDIGSDAQLHGTIAFLFACYGAGTPLLDEFAKQGWKERMPIAERPFVASLPQKMMGHPKGGTLAVVGHVERAWGFSFKASGVADVEGAAVRSTQYGTFSSSLRSVMNGNRVAEAFNYFDNQHAYASVELLSVIEDEQFGVKVDPYELVNLWTSNNDARGYILLGDPAVQLPVVAEGETASEEQIELSPISVKTSDIDADEGGADSDDSAAENELLIEDDADKGDEAPVDSFANGGAGEEGLIEFGLRDTARDIRASLEDAARKLSKIVGDAVDDLTTLQINTYTSEDLRKSASSNNLARSRTVQLRAQTRIKIDGDVESIVPVRKVESVFDDTPTENTEIDAELWQIHKEMVEVAQKNKVDFMKAIAEIAGTLLNTLR